MGSIFAPLSSVLAGLLRSAFSPEMPFVVSAVGAVVVVGYFARDGYGTLMTMIVYG